MLSYNKHQYLVDLDDLVPAEGPAGFFSFLDELGHKRRFVQLSLYHSIRKEDWPAEYLERKDIARDGSSGNFKKSESGEARRLRPDPDVISDTQQSDLFLLNLT